MAVLSWDEIRSRAMQFQNEWANETSENAESKTFWNEFFEVFGISRRRIATFEERVKIEGQTKFVDLLWKGKLLIEHKSRGRNLDKAYTQATNYFNGIKDRDLPQYILVSDFKYFRLYDLDNGETHQFELSDFYKNIQLFSFIAGYEKHNIKPQDPVNNKAAIMMGKIHDSLQAVNYTGNDLDTLLVRLVFCLFADDTGIFDKGLFRDFLEDNTSEDGSDLAPKLQYLFEILDTPLEERIVNDSIYNEFPYVNGSLFTKHLRTAVFNEETRSILLECSNLDWGRISPAIFGSMFQSAMDSEKRRHLGAHYTSEENIMKVIKPLFLDKHWEEFNRIKGLKRNKLRLLEEFQNKIANLNFFDPACGSGNFLIIAYREIRRLELAVLKEKNYLEFGYEAYKNIQLGMALNLHQLIKCDVNQFYGIEIDSFSAQIAQVALWIIDHQMNIEASLYFGSSFARLPLGEHADILNDNSLNVNWNNLLDARDCDYILGNPPFIGTTLQSKDQKKDMKYVMNNIKGFSSLDYVASWFVKATFYMEHTQIQTCFVSTDSICQGKQVTTLWQYLFDQNIIINFAYQSFKWSNEASNQAQVKVVIIGFSFITSDNKYLFVNGSKVDAKNINGYLLDDKNIFVASRRNPINNNTPKISKGCYITDDGHYTFRLNDKNDFIKKEPLSEPYFRPFYGGDEFIYRTSRYILFLKDCPPQELKKMLLVQDRIKKVREFRENSDRPSTKRIAPYPTNFETENIPEKGTHYIVIPGVSGGSRDYIPIGYVEGTNIPSQKVFIIKDNATLYHFGILNSKMHMLWATTVSGKKGDSYSYLANAYNNFMWPNVSKIQQKKIKDKALEILSVREEFFKTGSTYNDLYDPISMPIELLKKHHQLDILVEKAYRPKKFNDDNERLSYLFGLYENNIQ